MSHPPYRQNEGSYERDEWRRERRDEDRDFRSRDREREREPERFRRDYAANFENEDRAFENESRSFPGRGQSGQYEDWEQPRRFGSESGRYGSGQDWRQQQPSRRFGSQRNEWQSPEQQRYERFGEGGGYFGESGYFGGAGRYGESRRFEEGGRSGESRQRFGSESSEFGSERGYGGGSSERGQFSGRGPKNYRRSDQRIQEDVCDRLTSDAQIDASEIQVTVKDGEITLEGTVAERRMKRLAEDVAESAAGVNQVHNRLRIDEASASRSQGQGKEAQGSQSSSRQSSSRSSI